ncbi:MAG: penicillin-binding transpeptidase domain-containing protein [Clostridia bacterium]|nr:penicillin-binding transpeptidase domain-containing protein [Clostridia bacterium]
MKRRMIIILAVFVFAGFAALVGRLFYLQVITGNSYEQKAVEQQLRDIIVSPQRGTIYDCNMKALAVSATVWDLYVSPANLTNDEQRHQLANDLSKITGLDSAALFKQMKRNTSYEILARKLEKPEADIIRQYISQKKLGCIGLVEDSKRYYPYGSFAAQVLGFTGADNQGLGGLESEYDSVLRGVPGRIVSVKNAKGIDMSFKYDSYIAPKAGTSLVLTVDEVVQHFLEKGLSDAVVTDNVANKATGIVMNVDTGAILAMATVPEYDPNNAFTLSASDQQKLKGLSGDALTKEKNTLLQAMWRNKAISDPYEPGSTFKIMTTAAALNEKVVKPSTMFFDPGYLIVGGRRIKCWKAGGHGSENFLQGLENSCNPVFMTIAAWLGPSTFFRYFNAFGLTQKTGIDLPGEAGNTGLYHTAQDLNAVELAVTAFGQTFKITPIQMITAVAAACNGGKLVTPHLVDREVDSTGKTVKTFGTAVKTQVISADTSKLLDSMLEQVVSVGTGKNAYVAGYRVAGKTGTSQKIDVDGGAYLRIASFMAFAPADDPKVALLVILDEPHAANNYGGVIAAPVAGSILSDILPYIGIKPIYTAKEQQSLDVSTPDVTGKTAAQAQAALRAVGLTGRISGSGETVLEQMPAAGESIASGGTVILTTGPEMPAKTVPVPKLAGLTVSAANKALAALGLNIRIEGASSSLSGVTAYSQDLTAGAEVKPGTVVTVKFRDNSIDVN